MTRFPVQRRNSVRASRRAKLLPGQHSQRSTSGPKRRIGIICGALASASGVIWIGVEAAPQLRADLQPRLAHDGVLDARFALNNDGWLDARSLEISCHVLPLRVSYVPAPPILELGEPAVRSISLVRRNRPVVVNCPYVPPPPSGTYYTTGSILVLSLSYKSPVWPKRRRIYPTYRLDHGRDGIQWRYLGMSERATR